VTCSTGNHGAAVAYAARQVGLPATVFLPERANPVKRARIAELGATVIESGRDVDEAREHAARDAAERGWYFVEDGRDPDLRPGPATIAWEILAEVPATDVIYVPVGDTTLIRGVALGARLVGPAVRIIGVQAERAPAYYRSWREQQVVSTDACDTMADGLAVRAPSAENVEALRELVSGMRLVSEAELLRGIYRLLLDEHVLAEPAGAAATAAFLATGRAHAGQTVVLLVTGGNITPEVLRQALMSAPELAG
jgi:threonine dehydratase